MRASPTKTEVRASPAKTELRTSPAKIFSLRRKIPKHKRFQDPLAIIPQIISVLIDFADYNGSRRLSGYPFFSTRAFLTQYPQIPRFSEGQNIHLAENRGPKGGNMVALLK